MTTFTPHCYDDNGDRLHDPLCLLPDGACRDRADALGIADADDRAVPNGTADPDDLTTVRADAARAGARFADMLFAYGRGTIGRAQYRDEQAAYVAAMDRYDAAIRATYRFTIADVNAAVDAAADPWAGGELAARIRRAQDRLVGR